MFAKFGAIAFLIGVAEISTVTNEVVLNTCSDLQSVKIAIPAALTVYSRPITFGLSPAALKCSVKQNAALFATENSRNLKNPKGAFHKDGYLLFGSTYYAPENYCIQKITSDGMEIELCSQQCGVSQNSVCVKKCCDLDKVLDGLSGGTCQFSDLRWSPIVYESNGISPSIRKFRSGKLVTLPDETPVRIGNSSLQTKYEIGELDCATKDIVTWSLRNLSQFGLQNVQFRFLSNSSLLYFNNSKWNLHSSSFCIDGVQNYGMNLFYTGSLMDQVVQTCLTDTKLKKETTTIRTMAIQIWIPIVYGIVMTCSCSLLCITIIVYFLLRNKQKFHMWVVASYILSLLLLNLLFGISNILSQIGMSTNDGLGGSASCILIGAGTHLLILSTFIWLTFLNLNIWVTFRTLISSPSLSFQRHGMKRFLLFSMISWGLPFIFVGMALTLDHLNRMADSAYLFGPGYGNGRCLISTPAEGIYLFYPVGILIIFNAGIFIFTIFRISLYQELSKQLNSANPKNNRQWRLIRIYTMLLLTATALWMTEFVAWHFGWDASAPYWIIIDSLNLLQSILIFIIFVCRKKTWENLEEKYPTVKRASMYFSPNRKSKLEKEILISK